MHQDFHVMEVLASRAYKGIQHLFHFNFNIYISDQLKVYSYIHGLMNSSNIFQRTVQLSKYHFVLSLLRNFRY